VSDLERFIVAQDQVLDAVRAELGAGRKLTHWMWFVFPQLATLGRSATAHYYGIADLAEAKLYYAHRVLGPRLVECSGLVLDHDGESAHDIFGAPDDLKLRSSMTLFHRAAPDEAVFSAVLLRYFEGAEDPLTLLALDQR
jgi:uncharacterized protein (DUF1810 family)